MSTITEDQKKPPRLPPRPVQDREKSFPVLSIAYRTFAQHEIWCIDGGDGEVDAYCNAFRWIKGDPEPEPPKGNLDWLIAMLREGASGGHAHRLTIRELVVRIFKECKEGEEKFVMPDHNRKYPYLTRLYHHYVIHGKNEANFGFPGEDVEDLKRVVFSDLYSARLIW